jgi:hypothetical protein
MAFFVAFAFPLQAETGTSAMARASRLGAWRAVMSSDGIELRDYLNRPISKSELRKELRAGAQEVRKEAAGLSEVPGLKSLLAFLDREDLNAAALRTEGPPARNNASAAALAPGRSPKVALAGAYLAGAAPHSHAGPVLSSLQFTTTPGRVRVQVLLL